MIFEFSPKKLKLTVEKPTLGNPLSREYRQYGAVYKAKEKQTQRQFALKKVPTLNDEAARRDIEFEAGKRQCECQMH
jgi:hypothetical protein